jgi:sortase A
MFQQSGVMTRIFSYILIIGGLVIAGLGLHTVWTSYRAGKQAEKQWERMVLSQPRVPQPAGPSHHFQVGETMARLSIDRLDTHWIVLEGADKKELRLGPGHLVNTALPGSRGNCVIAGHRDTQFRILRNVEIGEKISLEIDGHTYTYRVIDKRVVAPTDNHALHPTPTPTLTLVTCYPFYYVGAAPKRFVIRAELAY